MNWSEFYLSAVNPYALRELLDYDEVDVLSGLVVEANNAFPPGVETEFMTGKTDARWLRLWRFTGNSAWAGTPVAILRFKVNGASQQDYDQVWTNDQNPLFWNWRVYVEVPPFSTWSVSLENLTNPAVNRPSLFILSGFYFRPRLGLNQAPSRGGVLR